MKWIVCNNLTKVYDIKGKKINALDDVTFEINNDEIVGVLGPNGAGKTTLIKCICNLVIPTSGEIYIKEIKTSASNYDHFNHVSAVLEGSRNIFWRLTVKENLEFFAGLQGYSFKLLKNEIDSLLDLFQLRDKTKTEARFLSRGMQQKLAIACALIRKTDIILLDEPTLGLDIEMVWEIKQFFRNKNFFNGRTLLISSHNMNFVESICDRVIIINNGRILADKKISELKSFFKIKEYELIINTPTDLRILNTIKEKFNAIEIQNNVNTTKLKIILSEDFQLLSELIKFITEENINLLDICNREPDFEEIYMKLIKGYE